MSSDSTHPEEVPGESQTTLGHLLYISDAVRSFNRAELQEIRDVSVPYNAEHGITGVLFYSAGHFVQLLEGDMGVIHKLFDKIASDCRHKNVKLLVLRPAERRIFSGWEMGLLDLDGYGEAEQRDLQELIMLASQGEHNVYGTSAEMAILSRFCMLLPAE
jgi:hypothetical protein